MRAARRALAVVVAALAWMAAGRARANIERYAVIIGNDAGNAREAVLRYAETDAEKVHDVLADIGGFRRENMVVLRGQSAAEVERQIVALNDRIRGRVENGAQAILVVYYSGHADAVALHLGRSSLELARLERLVNGSPASFRLLVLDSCRSGAVARLKGGRRAPPLQIVLDERLADEGVVFWAASAADEDAQESDELKGSFFTHYLVSGLLGAADANGDGRVTLEEAYRHAYDHTLRASSQTLAGLQHPTFSYRLQGRGDFVLTTPGEHGERATLVLPGERTYLVMAGGRDGSVMAEVGSHESTRWVSLRPGRYFLRGRGEDDLREGNVVLRPGDRQIVREDRLDRLAYARLVRKGLGIVGSVHGVQTGYRIRSALLQGASPCQGGFFGYSLDREHVSLASRVGFCQGGRQGMFVDDTMDEGNLEVRAAYVHDLPIVTLEFALAPGAALLRRTFTTTGVAPDRFTAAAYVAAGIGASAEVYRGFSLAMDVDAQTYFYRERSSSDGEVSWVTPFALRGSVHLDKRF